MKERKWLIILPDSPYPSKYGDTLLTSTFLAALSERNIKFSLICTTKSYPNEQAMEKLRSMAENVWIIIRKYNIKNFISLIPFQNASRIISKVDQEQILKKILTGNFEVIYCHGLYTFNLGYSLAKKIKLPLILRSNNIESVFFQGLYKSTAPSLSKIYYLFEKFKFKNLESRIFKGRFENLKLIFELSYNDYLSNKDISSVPIEFLPPFFQEVEGRVPSFDKTYQEINLLYIGSLFSANNIHGLKFFLNNIWQNILKKNNKIKFKIVGSRPSTDFMTFTKRFKNVELIPDVENVEEYYKTSYLFINPIYFGSGINMKNIEALYFGVPVITTQVGCRGLSWKTNEEIECANSDIEFEEKILYYINYPKLRNMLALKGYNYVIQNLNSKINLERMIGLIKKNNTNG